MPLKRYAHWLHTRWPAGTVEPLPEIGPDGSTNVPGLYVVGDLTGIPLLKFSSHSGARVVRSILDDPSFRSARGDKPEGVRDLIIVGAGVAGMAAALAAGKAGLDYRIFEAKRPFQTIADFPRGKPIYTYPTEMRPDGDLQFTAEIKEALVEEMAEQTRSIEVSLDRVERVVRRDGNVEVELSGGDLIQALRVVVAIGRSGNFRKLGVDGETCDKVFNRLHDPREYGGKRVLVVGGGDSALETAIALDEHGSDVTLSYRKKEFTRPKPDNVARLDGSSVRLEMQSSVKSIGESEVVLERPGGELALPNDVVFSMIGREAPLDFFRRAGVRIAGEWNWKRIAAMSAFLLFCLALYNWKSGGMLDTLNRDSQTFPYSITSDAPAGSLPRILAISAAGPSFWYTLAYSALVVIFGFRRIARRKTPYVKVQTLTLMAVQVLPLFLLPEIILPWLDARGWLPSLLADSLFPQVSYGHGREFWRAYGLILAWPLNVYNVFTDSPLWAWLGIAFIQTFVLIPGMIYFWGKGAYCGWVCSCGALAETLGDNHRHKMPHGPTWNRLNMAGQVVLAVAVLLLIVRILSWILPESGLRQFSYQALSGSTLSYKWIVDVFLAGVVGYGVYFWLSGRFWCRFFCPLAALMHIYARFSRFRILADKKKCISCNVCTSVCHQGIDVMNFANKGLPMADPECVRCSACVSSCPTGVLSFGQVDAHGNVVGRDRLAASPVSLTEP